jgi:hypothetical protein
MFFASRPRLMHRQSPTSPRAHRTQARGKLYSPIRLEQLEERCLLATTLAGNGLGPNQLPAAYGQLPLSFEANQGQTAAQVNFLARGPGYALFLTPGEAVLSLQKPAAANPGPGAAAPAPEGDVLRMQLVGASATPQVAGLDQLPGTSNYFIGNDPSQWHTNVPNFARVAYQGLYPGVDLVYYGNQRQLEYDFVVAPGASAGAIRLEFQGAESMALDAQGNLVLHTAGGDVVEQAPVLYQQSGGVRQAVPGRFVLEGDGQVGFAVGAYDASRPLIIDPVLSYSTYLGGSGGDSGLGIAVDGAGNAYLTGRTTSTDFPTANPIQAALSGDGDAFVAKLNASGTALAYSTYLGGSGFEEGTGIATDGAGNAYLTGLTSSTNFPTADPLQAAYGGGLFDAFVAKLNASGTALAYSTYLGGSGDDEGNGIAVDSAGNAYLTGHTTSTDFPTINPLQAANGGGRDAFVAKVNASGAALVYSTYLGGNASIEYGQGIAVDSAGNAYVTGSTDSTNFPTANAIQVANGGFEDAFVAKLNASGTALAYSTYLGGSGHDGGFGIAVDSAGNAYVIGSTNSTNFPTANPLQAANGGGYADAFVAKVNASGTALVYSTYLGGGGADEGYSIAVDSAGNAYVTGYTQSSNFPTVNAIQVANGGFEDAFVAKVNAAGTALVYSTYLGGSDFERGYRIAVDSAGNAYVTGDTQSSNFPTVNPLQASYGGYHDAFVAKIKVTTHFRIIAPASSTAGAPFSFTVVALDQNNNIDTSFPGVVHFTSPDGGATLPADYTFTAQDNGVHTFSATLTKAGDQPITVAEAIDGTVSGTATVTVSPAAASHFAVSAPATVTANSSFSVTVTALDPYNNVATGYPGTVGLSSTDNSATLPAQYTFTAGDKGVHTFAGLRLHKKGAQTITASDTLYPTITGTASVVVVGGSGTAGAAPTASPGTASTGDALALLAAEPAQPASAGSASPPPSLPPGVALVSGPTVQGPFNPAAPTPPAAHAAPAAVLDRLFADLDGGLLLGPLADILAGGRHR